MRDWLASEGWDDVFLDLDPERGIAAGERWERALHEAANRCEAVDLPHLEPLARIGLVPARNMTLARGLNKKLFAVIVDSGLTIAGSAAGAEGHLAGGRPCGGQDLQLYRATLPGSHEEKHVGFSRDGLRRLKRGLGEGGARSEILRLAAGDGPRRAALSRLEAVGRS